MGNKTAKLSEEGYANFFGFTFHVKVIQHYKDGKCLVQPSTEFDEFKLFIDSTKLIDVTPKDFIPQNDPRIFFIYLRFVRFLLNKRLANCCTNLVLQMLVSNRNVNIESEKDLKNLVDFMDFPTLNGLRWNFHMLTADGSQSFNRMVKLITEQTYVSNLDLSGCGNLKKHGIVSINQNLSACSSLKELHICNNIGDEGTILLSQGLCDNSTLEILDLHFNFIGNEGIYALSKMLEDNKSINHLDLNYNVYTIDGLRALVNALNVNKSLAKLYIGGNDRIDHVATVLIADLLKQNSTIVELSLGRCRVGDAGGVLLAESLRENKTLKNLYLSCNWMQDLAGEAFLNAMLVNETLELITIKRNYFCNDVAKRLENEGRFVVF